jgi:hypothetical protein
VLKHGKRIEPLVRAVLRAGKHNEPLVRVVLKAGKPRGQVVEARHHHGLKRREFLRRLFVQIVVSHLW